MIEIFFYCLLATIAMCLVYQRYKDKTELALGIGIGILAAFVVYFGSLMLQASSFEVLSGSVTGKSWAYDPEEESYSCGTDGKDTCYREIPRWRWDVHSDTGAPYTEYTYVKTSPDIWDAAQKGQPFARNKLFFNFQYVHDQSVLFDKDARYVGWLPQYPSIYYGYHINRCMSNVVDCEELGRQLRVAHQKWGPKYQVNAMVAIVHEKAAGFADALRNEWTGGKKNDTVLVLYVDKDLMVKRADVFGRSTSNKRNAEYADFNLILREQASRIGMFNEEHVVAALDSALPFFEREDLSKYNFMADAYRPPLWTVALHILIIGLTMFVAVREYRRRNYGLRRYRY